jgi:hypothetical protein
VTDQPKEFIIKVNITDTTSDQWNPGSVIALLNHLGMMSSIITKQKYMPKIVDVTQGWQEYVPVAGAVVPNDHAIREPGLYSVIYDPDKTHASPVDADCCVYIGQSYTSMLKRIRMYEGGLIRGATSNHGDVIRITAENLRNIVGDFTGTDFRWFYRPHSIDELDDPEWIYEKAHSEFLEKLAFAAHKVLTNNHMPVGNYRDDPPDELVADMRVFLGK